jgi:stage V sporulation protein G
MKVTEVRIRQSLSSICFDDCFLVHDIRVIKGPTGLFISFPNRTKERGSAGYRISANAETRRMIEQAVLAEYEKVVAGSDPVPRETK